MVALKREKSRDSIIDEFLSGIIFVGNNWKMLLPFFGTIAIYGAYQLFFRIANVTDIKLGLPEYMKEGAKEELPVTGPSIDFIVIDLQERLYYFFSEFLLAITFLSAIFVSAYYIADSFFGKSFWKISGIIFFPAAVMVFIGLSIYNNFDAFTPIVMIDIMQILQANNGIEYLTLLKIMSIGAVISVSFLMFAFCAVLMRPLENSKMPPVFMGIFCSRLKILLYLGATVLVAAVLSIYVIDRSITQLPIWPFNNNVVREALMDIAYTHSMINGGFYTLLLLGMYAPAAAVFQNSLVNKYHEEDPEATLDELKKRMVTSGLVLTTKDQIFKFAALFAPLIAGFSVPAAVMLQNLA
jgi:hypothetical protein